MALGHVLSGGSYINAMVWSRGMERNYEAWERSGAKGWGFKDVLPTYKTQEDWDGGANEWRGTVYMKRLFDYAYQAGVRGYAWQKAPPSEPSPADK